MKSFIEYLAEQNRRLKIYCDLDETLVDFYSTANPIINNDWGNPEAWAKMDRHTWANMQWKSGGKKIWEKIKSMDYTPWILTKAPVNGNVIYGKKYSNLHTESKPFLNAVRGKLKWIEYNLGEDQLDRTIICPINFKKSNIIRHKPKGKKYVLVDDNKEYISDWENAGGVGILRTTTEETLNKLNSL